MVEDSKEHRKLAAIMFTDIVGYSALTQKNEKLALALLDEHQHILRAIFPKHGGREIETAGDSFFVEFDSALQAAQCAVEIQTTLTAGNSTRPAGRTISLRIGLHLGDVVLMGEKVHGDGVNIAARVEPLAKPGGICITEDVARQIQNKLDMPVVKLGRGELKNIKLPIDVYQIVMPWEKKGQHWPDRFYFLFRQRRIQVSVVLYLVSGILEAAILFFIIRAIFGPSPASLLITSDPTGASVFFNGHQADNTPANFRELPAGPITLRIDRGGYVAKDTTVTLAAGQHLSLSFSLKKSPVENESAGTGKLINTLQASSQIKSHASQLPQDTHHGSDPEPHGAIVPAGKPPSPGPTSTLVLQVIPNGSIFLDHASKPMNADQAVTLDVPAGEHTIRFENSQYGSKEITVNLLAKETLKRTFYFQRYVSISSLPERETLEPIWAMIVIDGKNTGITTPRDRYPLSPGTHHITVTRSGYDVVEGEKELNVTPSTEDQPIRLIFHLRKKQLP